MHSVVLVAEERLPRGAVALGDGGGVELLRGDFFEGARVSWVGERWRELLWPQLGWDNVPSREGEAGNSPAFAWPQRTCCWGQDYVYIA